MTLLAGFRLALGTLTIIPVGEIRPLPPRAPAVAMTLAPLAALPVGVLAGLVLWLGGLIDLPGLVVAALALGAVALGTRAMHLDGLTDTVDGLGGGWTRERALEIMRRGDVGPMGVTALVLVLLVQVGALVELVAAPRGWLVLAVTICAARFAATVLCTRGVPAARGSGMGAAMAGSVPVVVTAVVGVLLAVVLGVSGVAAGVAWWWGPIVAASGWLMMAGLGLVAVRRFGGITGDVLGAGIELSCTVMLVVWMLAR